MYLQPTNYIMAKSTRSNKVSYTDKGVKLTTLKSTDFRSNIFIQEKKADQYFKTPKQLAAEPKVWEYHNEY